uniref:Uncharacterized protein n=1 Tax=Plectus sambesii TaxID=2011161 RepID=A0A914XES6_9BILA
MESFSSKIATLAGIVLLLRLDIAMSKALRKKSCESVDVTLLLHTAGSEVRTTPVDREIYITISAESDDNRPLPDVTYNLRRSNYSKPFIAGQYDAIDLEIPHDFDKRINKYINRIFYYSNHNNPNTHYDNYHNTYHDNDYNTNDHNDYDTDYNNDYNSINYNDDDFTNRTFNYDVDTHHNVYHYYYNFISNYTN